VTTLNKGGGDVCATMLTQFGNTGKGKEHLQGKDLATRLNGRVLQAHTQRPGQRLAYESSWPETGGGRKCCWMQERKHPGWVLLCSALHNKTL